MRNSGRNGRLNVCLDPLPDESLPGFLMRVARRVTFHRADRLANIVGLRQPGAVFTWADLGPLVGLIGTREELLAAAVYRPVERVAHHRFLGGVVHREFLDVARRRFCPRCMAVSAHHRTRWDFALATACVEHGVRLVDHCQRCNRRFGWLFPNLVRCRCGAEVGWFACEAVGAPEMDANRAMLEMVSGEFCIPDGVRAVDGADLPWLAMNLGMFATGWRGQRRIEKLVAAGLDETAEVLVAGTAALRDWPFSIHRLLKRQARGAAERRGRYGGRKVFGAFYDWLTMMVPGPMKEALAAAASGYVALDGALVRRTHRSALLRVDGPSRFIGLVEASTALGVSGEAVKRLMATGALPTAVSNGRGIPMLIERASVEALASVGTMDLAEAARALDISKGRVRRLFAGGLLSAGSHRCGVWTFPTASVDGLLTRLSASAATTMPGRPLRFDGCAEALRRRDVGLAEIIAMIEAGTLQVAGLDGEARGLKRLMFDRVAVRTLCRRLEGDGMLTVQAAAERMGLKWAVVANLVARGLLGAVDGRIAAADADRFTVEHVAGSKLALEIGTSPKSLATMLARRGILPVAGPGVDGSRLNLYRRASL